MADADLSPPHRVVLEEACRVADRLDRLDALLSGRDDWLRLRAEEFGSDRVLEVRVVVDNLLGEARQQEAVLRGLVSELRQGMATARKPSSTSPAAPAAADQAAPPPGVLSLAGSAAARRRGDRSPEPEEGSMRELATLLDALNDRMLVELDAVLAREESQARNERAAAWWRAATRPSRDQGVPAADRPGGARDATRIGIGEARAPLALVRTP